MTELRGKARADLRNEHLRRLLKAWETRRDELCDEISFKKGQLELLEEHIRFAYQAIIDVNKEEGERERTRLVARVEEIQKLNIEEDLTKMRKKKTKEKEKIEKPRKKQAPKRKIIKKK